MLIRQVLGRCATIGKGNILLVEKRYIRTKPDPVSNTKKTQEEIKKSAIDFRGNVFTFKHGPAPNITPIPDLGPYEIRLQNIGCKNRRFDRIVVQRMKHSPNVNEIVENLGSYESLPNIHNEILVALNLKRLRYWIGIENVVINPRVQQLLGRSGFLPVHPSDYITAYRARKQIENNLRYPVKSDDEIQENEETSETVDTDKRT